jgi:hypothetical protein
MKTINIWALVIFLLGLAFIIFAMIPCPFTDYASCGLGRGMLVIWFGYPLIIISIILFIIGLFIGEKK